MLSAPTPPTRRISANSDQRNFARRNLTIPALLTTYQASGTATSAVVKTMATPPPATPRAGSGPKPKMNIGDSGISTTTLKQMTAKGNNMTPAPRMTLASALVSHSSVLSAKTTSE